ncbi:hypothetical protein EYF80_018024 [Liparis tanakae]|uniref:Uncharacterized protein n=1 Tax=Liparis tanakae TaxID=230148 RepID=A0A4Z2I353_9TELE|nr:hypothetical protein EYF80_018024 [Liparis tanakae]
MTSSMFARRQTSPFMPGEEKGPQCPSAISGCLNTVRTRPTIDSPTEERSTLSASTVTRNKSRGWCKLWAAGRRPSVRPSTPGSVAVPLARLRFAGQPPSSWGPRTASRHEEPIDVGDISIRCGRAGQTAAGRRTDGFTAVEVTSLCKLIPFSDLNATELRLLTLTRPGNVRTYQRWVPGDGTPALS